jgi:phosphate transport system substrate-binding protein
MAFRCRTALAVAALPLALATGCGNGGSGSSGSPIGSLRAAAVPAARSIPLTPAPSAESLSETGSTLLFPLLHAWAAAYHQQHPQVTFTTGATGSGAGIADASAGTVDIGASDAYLSSGNMVQNPKLLNVPLAISAQQIDYNLPGLKTGVHIRLNGAVLAQMYQGRITAWNDAAITALNPGLRLPSTKVMPLHRSDSSGDTFLFTSYLSTHDSRWNSVIGYGTSVAWPARPGPLAWHGNSGMVAGCKSTPGCVAYVGISYLSAALAAGLGEARLANASGQFVLPTTATIRAAVASFASSTPPNETISMVDGPAAGSYPIVNYEYAIVTTHQRTAARARDVRAFLHWAISTGSSARYLNDVRFQPLPGSVAVLSDEQIAKIR